MCGVGLLAFHMDAPMESACIKQKGSSLTRSLKNLQAVQGEQPSNNHAACSACSIAIQHITRARGSTHSTTDPTSPCAVGKAVTV